LDCVFEFTFLQWEVQNYRLAIFRQARPQAILVLGKKDDSGAARLNLGGFAAQLLVDVERFLANGGNIEQDRLERVLLEALKGAIDVHRHQHAEAARFELVAEDRLKLVFLLDDVNGARSLWREAADRRTAGDLGLHGP